MDALVSGLAPRVRKENERVNSELTHLAERAQVAASASGAAIALLGGDALICRGRAGTTAPAQGARLELTSGLSGECARTGGIMLCDDVEADERVDVNACRTLGIRSILVVPLYDKGEVIGIFEVFSPERQAFGHEDVAVLQTMAEMAVAVVRPTAVQQRAGEAKGGEAKAEIIAASPPPKPPVPETRADASIDLSKLIVEEEPIAAAQPPPILIQFPPAGAGKNAPRTEEVAPFHDPEDDLVCELGPERIADLLEQPQIEDPAAPALKLFHTANEPEVKTPGISRKLLIAAAAVLLIALLWLKFCNHAQTAPADQSSELPAIHPDFATPAITRSAPQARPRTADHKQGKLKAESVASKKSHDAPVAEAPAEDKTRSRKSKATVEPVGSVHPVEVMTPAEHGVAEDGPEVATPSVPVEPPPALPGGTETPNLAPPRMLSLAHPERMELPRLATPRSTEALADLERAASTGDPQAELSLAVRYANGDGVRRDYYEAVRWFTQAAAQGVTPTEGKAADAWKRTRRWLAGHEKELAQNH